MKEGLLERQDQDWNEMGSDESDEDNEENYNTTLAQDDQKKLVTMTKEIKKRFDFLENDEIRTAILECEFDTDKIDKYLEKYEIEDKYKGINAYEWKIVEEKPIVNKKKGRGNKRPNQRDENNQYQQNYNRPNFYEQDNYHGYYEHYEEPNHDQKEGVQNEQEE